ncbi:MAG: hypothetical protein RSB77_03135 [Bacilli bacterium]
MGNDFSVNIFTINDGLISYKDIKFIRIKSEEYNLLIMKDYMPIVGEINGSISFEGLSTNETYENIKAYYMSKENEFNLIIKENNA